VRRVGPADLVIAGTVSSDGYSGVLASQLAELLGLPALTFARNVRLAGGSLAAERETRDGHDDVECPLPCVLSVMTGSVTPRFPSYKAIVDSRRKPVEVVGLADLGLPPPAVGQEIVSVTPAADGRGAGGGGGEIVDDDGHAPERIADLLARLKVL
jgi:electron transfer flavoprotein beta subunit